MPPIRLFGRGKSGKEETVNRSIIQKVTLRRSKTQGPWLFLNILITSGLIVDVVVGKCSLAKLFTRDTSWKDTASNVELAVTAIALVNLISAVVMLLKPYWRPKSIFVTAKQRQLLGIHEKEPGFKTLTLKPLSQSSPIPSPVSSEGRNMCRTGKSYNLDWLFHLKKSPRKTPTSSTTWNSSAQWSIGSPSNLSTWNDSGSYSPGQPLNWTLESTPSYPDSYGTPSHSFLSENEFSSSFRHDTSDLRVYSERKPTFSESLMRMRRAKSSSPFLKGKEIRSKTELRRYLVEFDQKQKRSANQSVGVYPVYSNQMTYEPGTVEHPSIVLDRTGMWSMAESKGICVTESLLDHYHSLHNELLRMMCLSAIEQTDSFGIIKLKVY